MSRRDCDFSAEMSSVLDLEIMLLYRLCKPATWWSIPVWQRRGSDQILRKILLQVYSRNRSSDDDSHRADPNRARQKLWSSFVFIKGSQQEKVCSMELALRQKSFWMDIYILFDGWEGKYGWILHECVAVFSRAAGEWKYSTRAQYPYCLPTHQIIDLLYATLI